ncbi:MAG: hypothetical protein DRN66_04375 [Candidatus Nanohalarchaeota archaeon]|nr:MAG: hypothetical protein DRN66_04375 [Candidatus Nanohaloarchaeota archaeon]
MLFSRKKEVSPEKKTDMNSIEKYMSSVVIDIKTDIDRLKAHTEAEKEIRKSSQERFSHLNETIGELREMLIESEKKYQNLEEKTAKAIDLMDALEPEKIDSRIDSQDRKLEKENAKVESNSSMIKNLVDELKSVKTSISQFRGVDKVIETASEIRRAIHTYAKVQANVDRSANKVENIFIDVQKNFNEFQKYRQRLKEIEKSFSEVVRDFDAMRIEAEKSKSLVDAVGSIKKRAGLYEEKIDNFILSFDEINKRFEKKFNEKFAYMDVKFAETEENSKRQIDELIKIIDKKAQADQRILKRLNSFDTASKNFALKKEIEKMNNHFSKETDKKIKRISRKLDSVVLAQGKISKLEKGNQKQINRLSKIIDKKTQTQTRILKKLNSFDTAVKKFALKKDMEKMKHLFSKAAAKKGRKKSQIRESTQ